MQESPPESGLTPEQIRVIELLAAGDPIITAAAKVGIDPATIHRWKQGNKAFNDAWESLLASLWGAIKAELKTAGTRALRVLCDVMNSPEASNKEKTNAAQIILNNLHKVVTDDELRKRVEVLIAQMENKD